MSPYREYVIPFPGKIVAATPAVQANPARAGYYRPWRFTPADKSGCSRIKEYNKTSKVLKINLDIRQFPPDAVTCAVEGNTIVVKGHHDERTAKIGVVAREFTRVYKVPEDIDLKTLTSKISKTGVLRMTAMKIEKPKEGAQHQMAIFPRLEDVVVKRGHESFLRQY